MLPPPRMGERIGVLGGTFDPPHVGHAIVAQDVLERLELDRLLIVPAGRPPHREAVLPAELRYRLAATLFSGADGLEVSDVELRRPGPSYTVDTLAEIRTSRRPETLFCIIGSDQLAAIDTWHEYSGLAELASVAVMLRKRDGAGAGPSAPVPYTPVEVTHVDLSSTRIRDRLRAGLTIRYLVPECIRAEVERGWSRYGGKG